VAEVAYIGVVMFALRRRLRRPIARIAVMRRRTATAMPIPVLAKGVVRSAMLVCHPLQKRVKGSYYSPTPIRAPLLTPEH
jgi:hypothetical protein